MRLTLRGTRFLIPLTFLFVGCKPTPAPSTSAADAAAVDAGAIVGASDAAKTTTEAAARALVEAWVSAQNAAAFPKYEALYAARFEGIRRSGEQAVKLDRARWMRERERMFHQKTTVTVKEIVIAPSHDGAEVRFIQTWVSDSYRDEGSKRMVLVREGASGAPHDNALKIAREEMLSSKVAPPGTTLPEDKFAFVIDGTVPELVIANQAKDEWAAGAPKVTSMAAPVTTRRELTTALPSELNAWKGKRVELFGKGGGSICEGTIGALAIVGRVIPHFGTSTRWRGTNPDEPKPAPAVIAQEAWDLSDISDSDNNRNGRVVVGDVTVDKGDCKGALWGRAMVADAATPTLVSGTRADATTAKQARAELRKTHQYSEIQAGYVAQKEAKDPPQWDDFDPTVETTVFTHPMGTIVTIAIRAGAGCALFGATLSAVFENKDGKLTLLHEPFDGGIAPLSVGDVDGDGRLDVIEKEVFMRSRGTKLDDPNKLSVPDLDCGC